MERKHFRPDFANMTPAEKTSYWLTTNRNEKFFKATGIKLEQLQNWCNEGYPEGLILTDNEKAALKEFAEASGLSLEKLAEKAGLKKSVYYNRLTSGKNKIRVYVFPRLYRRR